MISESLDVVFAMIGGRILPSLSADMFSAGHVLMFVSLDGESDFSG
jgi:hypothetical protein